MYPYSSSSSGDGRSRTKSTQSLTFESVSGLYEFFSDEDDSTCSVIDELSFLSSPRSRTHTESSVQSVESSRGNATAPGRDDHRYCIATETAYCMLHERSHHSIAAKMLIAIARTMVG